MASKRDIVVTLEFNDKGSAKIKKTVADTTAALGGAGKEAGRTGAGFEKLKQSAAGAEGGFKKLASSFKSNMMSMAAGMGMWTSMAAVIHAVTANLKDIVTKGREFDSAFAKVKVMLAGTGVNASELKEQVLRLSPALGRTADMAKLLSMTMREFTEMPIAEKMKLVEEGAKLATSAFTSSELAMEALIALMKGYHLEAASAANVSSMLAKAMQLEDVSFEEMTKTILKLGPSAFQAGVKIEELVGTFLTLMHTGQDAQTSMMQMRMLMQGIIKPSDAAKKAAHDLGLQWGAAGVKAQGFQKWLTELNRVAGGNLNVLDNLFQGGRTLVGVLNLTTSASAELTSNVEKLGGAYKEATENQRVFMERLGSINFLTKTAGEMFDKLKISIWQGFTKEITKGQRSAEDIKKSIDRMTQSLIDWGLTAGKHIAESVRRVGELVKSLVALKQPIRDIIELYAAWWAYQKLFMAKGLFSALKLSELGAALSLVFSGAGIRGKINNLGILIGKGLGSPIAGVTGALKALPAVAMAAFAGWKIGRLIGELTGADKMLQDLFEPKAKDRTGGFLPGHDAAEALRIKLIGAASFETGKNINDIGTAMDILKAKFKKTGDLGSEVLNKWAKDIGLVKEKAADIKLPSLTPTDVPEPLDLNALKEKMKSFGYTLKTDLEERYATLTQALKVFGNEMTKTDFKKVKDDIKMLGAALGYTSETFMELGLLTGKEITEEMNKASKQVADLKKGFLAGAISTYTFEKGLEAITARLQELNPYLKATYRGLEEIVNTPLPAPRRLETEAPKINMEGMFNMDWVVDPFMAANKAAELLGVTLKHDLVNSLDELKKAWDSLKAKGETTPETLVVAAAKLADAYKAAGEEVPNELKGVAASVTKTWDGVAQTMVDYWTQAMAEMIKSGLNFRDIINIGWQTLAVGAGQALGNMAKRALSSLGDMAGPIGSLIGSLAGSLISGLGKLFGIKSKAQKEAEAAKKAEADLKKRVDLTITSYKKFGEISESTAKKIVEMTKEFNRQTAAILTLTDVMNDAGISSKNLTQYLKTMAEALRDIAGGLVSAQEGIEAIGAAFGQIVGWAQQFGQEGKKALVTFIQALRQVGASIVEVDEYVFAQLEKGAEGMENMITAVGGASYKQLIDYRDQIKALGEEVADLSGQRLSDRSAQQDYLRKKAQLTILREEYERLQGTLADGLGPEMARMERMTLTTFNAFIAQGKSWTETVGLMGGSLTALRDKYTELGTTGGAAIQELFKIIDITEAQAGLMEGIEGNRQLLEALGNTGFLTAESFKDLSDQAASYYDQLVAGGLDSRQALAMIAPQLADLQYYADQNLSLSLDDSTKALIEQAKAAGLYKERGRDLAEILTDGFSGVIDALNELIKAFGGGSVIGGGGGGSRGGTGPGKQPYVEGYYPEMGYPTYQAQHGFKGVVTGPRFFEVEKGITEAVHIGTPAEVFSSDMSKNASMLMPKAPEILLPKIIEALAPKAPEVLMPKTIEVLMPKAPEVLMPKTIEALVSLIKPAEVLLPTEAPERADSKLSNTAEMLMRIKDAITGSVTTMVQNMTSLVQQQVDSVSRELAFAGAGAPAPRTFYKPPAQQQPHISITRPEAGKEDEKAVIVDRNITFEPIVIPYKELEQFVIKWVQKAGADERVLFRPRAVRGR